MTARPDGSAPPARSRFRRILLALDPSSGTLAAVDAVAALAARLDAEMRGLFVEDINLLRLAGHRDLSALSTLSARPQPLDSGVVERAIRIQIESCRRAIAEAARRQRVRFSFEVRRGRVADEVLALAEDADLVVVGWSSGGVSARPDTPWTTPGSIARIVAAGAARSVLLFRAGAVLTGPVLVAYDGSESGEHALAAALELALHDRAARRIELALLTSQIPLAETWRQSLSERLASEGVAASFLFLPDSPLEQMGRAARHDHIAILVLGADLPLLEGDGAGRLLDQIGCSILIVR